MKKSKLNSLLAGVVIAMSMFLFVFAGSKANAQEYCTNFGNNYFTNPGVTCYPGYLGSRVYYDWYFDVHVYSLAVYTEDGEEVFFWESAAFDGCYVYWEDLDPIELSLGSTYYIDITKQNRYYSYRGTDYCERYGYSNNYTHRLFIDWNIDGIFDWEYEPSEWINNDNADNPNRRDMNHNSLFRRYEPCDARYTYRYEVTVPDNAPLGISRLRAMAAYNYPYTYYYTYGTDRFDACHQGTIYYRWYDEDRRRYYNYGECEDYNVEFTLAVKDAFPREGSILYAGEDYDGTTREIEINDEMIEVDFEHPMVLFGGEQGAGTDMTYKITGPLPSDDVVFEALDPETGSNVIDVEGYTQYNIQSSRGDASPYGDGVFMSESGGEYKLGVSVALPGKDPKFVFYPFTVAWTNDLSVRKINSPRSNGSPAYHRYLRGVNIPVQVEFQNVGLNEVTEFEATAKIYDSDGNLKYERDGYWQADDDDDALQTGDFERLRFPNYATMEAGIYTIEIECDLLSGTDQEDYNDHLPRVDAAEYTFEVSYSTQLAAYEIVTPEEESTIVAKRPFRPKAIVENRGVGDASDIPVSIKIINEDGTIVEEDEETLANVPYGFQTKAEVLFDPMTINEPGEYTVCFEVSAYDDVVIEDNELCQTFYVDEGMEGTYTIGNTNEGEPGNFLTVDDAMDMLYDKGIVDDVVFYFTDDEYTIESLGLSFPAWDLTSRILGAGYDAQNDRYNTITFMPSPEKQLERESVKINLVSGNGKGVLFGQAVTHPNTNAVINDPLGAEYTREYANSNGHITFDGGPYKSFVFELHTEAEHGAVFYLDKGSQSITIKNCIIENNDLDLADNMWLPYTMYDLSQQEFTFDADSLVTETGIFSYSAGIVNRSTVLNTEEYGFLAVDTLNNINNKIMGNEISGFGYGILSLGIGQLLTESGNDFSAFYNMDNEYSGNIIYDCASAGILVGYEKDSKINNNYIYNIGGHDEIAAGVLAGTFSKESYKPYYNVGLEINGNEIHDVTSGLNAAGVLVIQSEIPLVASEAGEEIFPQVDQESKIVNNSVWSIRGTSNLAVRAGIALMTEREQENGTWSLLVPEDDDFFTKNDRIINNTVIIPADNNSAISAAILAQQVEDCKIYNNAIEVTGDNNPLTYTSALFFEGMLPNEGNSIESDRNVFWYPENNDAVIALFVETDENNEMIEAYMPNDFKNLDQWRVWTGQDTYSVFNNFMQDMVYIGYSPMQKLRIRSNPLPQGSVLNDRGEEFDWLETDIDGRVRGMADRRFDIGAVEFNGRKNVTDVELSYVNYPAAWQAINGQFADAEYIMDDGPVDVKAIARNDGSLERISVDLTVSIYREQPDGTFGDAVLTKTVEADIKTNESEIVSFGLADGSDDDFTPMTYSDLRLHEPEYTVPDHFSSMTANVTPIYKIVVETEPDEHNGNNVDEKYVRYYIQRSPMRVLVSSENTFQRIDEETDPSIIASSLNYDYLVEGIRDLGWYIDLTNTSTTEDDVFDFDNFDRAGWEPKAVNYRMYRSMFWSDGDGELSDPMTRLERKDIVRFFDENYYEDKQNLLIGSQEIVRTTNDEDFLKTYLSATNATPGNPLGENVSNDGNSVVGRYIGTDIVEDIAATGIPNDPEPYCGLYDIYTAGEGNAFVAYEYLDHEAAGDKDVMGVATTTLDRNVLVLGVDWRHFTDVYRVIRAGLDFVEKNDGYVIPVELANFDARYIGNRVSINWATASEMNTDRFEVEKAVRTSSGTSEFAKIAEVPATGNSQEMINYGPVYDRDVANGNVYVYRLKVVDFNGEFSYSSEREVEIGSEFWLSDAKPNPANDVVKFDLTGVESGSVELTIIDVDGKVIVPDYTLSGGVLEINLGNVASGTYTLMIKVGTTTMTRQFNVVK